MCNSEPSCACATAPVDEAPAAVDGIRGTYRVAGMTCGGCASTVSSSVSALAGVTDVRVDVASGELTVISDAPVPAADVRAAVVQAGYQFVG